MKIQPVVHHHFKFLKKFKNKPQTFKEVRFQYIPFFKLYSWNDFQSVDSLIISMTGSQPHAFQKIMSYHTPRTKERACYREDLRRMLYCKHNEQSYFVRAYYLRENGGDFYKVEIVLDSGTLGEGKYYSWDKAQRAANCFFDVIDKKHTPLNPIGLHLPDFFCYSFFEKQVRVLQDYLDALRDSVFLKEKNVLRELLISKVSNLEENSKEIASEHVSSLKREMQVQANLLE